MAALADNREPVGDRFYSPPGVLQPPFYDPNLPYIYAQESGEIEQNPFVDIATRQQLFNQLQTVRYNAYINAVLPNNSLPNISSQPDSNRVTLGGKTYLRRHSYQLLCRKSSVCNSCNAALMQLSQVPQTLTNTCGITNGVLVFKPHDRNSGIDHHPDCPGLHPNNYQQVVNLTERQVFPYMYTDEGVYELNPLRALKLADGISHFSNFGDGRGGKPLSCPDHHFLCSVAGIAFEGGLFECTEGSDIRELFSVLCGLMMML